MSLLEFARGPALEFSIAVLLFGTAWRLVGILLLRWRIDKSEPRSDAPSKAVGALRGVARHFWPHRAFWSATAFQTLNSYVFHIGLAVVVLGFGPHIAFIRHLTGFGWPNLPTPLITFIAILTVGSLFAALTKRLTSPVLRLISTTDDYLTWVITIVPLVTGIAAAGHIGARYETLLAIHILSVAVFLIWLPFSKLAHAFLFVFSRGLTGARLTRRGAKF